MKLTTFVTCALATIALPSLTGAATVSVAYGTGTGITDSSGAALAGGTVKFGHFLVDPVGIGADIAALEAQFIEVGSTASDSAGAAGFFESASLTFDDSSSFEGVAYNTFLGASVYALIVDSGNSEVGVALLGDTFRPDPTVGAGLPNSVANVALDAGVATGVIGDFSGPEIFAGATPASFQLVQQIPEPGSAALAGVAGALLLFRRRRA